MRKIPLEAELSLEALSRLIDILDSELRFAEAGESYDELKELVEKLECILEEEQG